MKHIKKNKEPKSFSDWCVTAKGNVNEDYRALQNPEKEDLHKSLIKEQGWLCGYTMRRIELKNSHIEHIKPESLCREDERGSDLYYSNMIACYPRNDLNPKYRYGAQAKGGWWEDEGKQFISPLNPICEKLFSFNLDGEIIALENTHEAKKTIQVLKLDHPSLTEDRRRAIKVFIFGENGDDPISEHAAMRAVEEIITKDKTESFYEFCIAIKYALNEYISQLKKNAVQKKFASKNIGRKNN